MAPMWRPSVSFPSHERVLTNRQGTSCARATGRRFPWSSLQGYGCPLSRASGEAGASIFHCTSPATCPRPNRYSWSGWIMRSAPWTRSVVALIPHKALLRLVRQRPVVGFALWRETLIDAAIFRQAITNNGARPLPARLAHFFCEQFYRARGNRSHQGGCVPVAVDANRNRRDRRGVAAIDHARFAGPAPEQGLQTAPNRVQRRPYGLGRFQVASTATGTHPPW